MKDKKKIVIGALCALIMIMAVGYALLSQQLSINGSASITSNWQVEITNINEKEKSTGATTNNTNYTATTASFNTSLTSPGDYALYEVTVTNKGTLDAVLSAKPTVTTGNNEAIGYELEGIKKGDKILKNNQTDTFTIKVTYNSSTTTQPSNLTSNIEVTLNYEQDLGQVVVYDTYSIGDVVSFADSDWYVIKNSTDDEDYVTLLKKENLTTYEITNNYADYEGGYYTPRMTFNRSCYNNGGCSNHNKYEESTVREMLENAFLPTIDPNLNKTKEINGYRIRLINKSDLVDNLGFEYQVVGTTEKYVAGDNGTNFIIAPHYEYSQYASTYTIYSAYWTMIPSSLDNQKVMQIYAQTQPTYIWTSSQYGYENYVRPVINLLKSSIE